MCKVVNYIPGELYGLFGMKSSFPRELTTHDPWSFRFFEMIFDWIIDLYFELGLDLRLFSWSVI